jgi:cytochrome c nitrite reductase small subunit
MAKTANQELNKKAKISVIKGRGRQKAGWTIVGIIALVLVIAGGAAGAYMIHLSNTSPEFCATCHVMKPNVDSYLNSNNLDNIHDQANVECKECHDYPVTAEISSGIKFLVGNYTVGKDGKLLPVTYSNEICLKCHISYEHIAQETAYIDKNPHKSHQGELPCKTCHVSHGEQIDYCSSCHNNGEQKMVGEDN